MKNNCIIVDIDNTFLQYNHSEVPFPDTISRADWDMFHKKMLYYTPEIFTTNKDVVELIANNAKKNIIIFITAREDTLDGLIRKNTLRSISEAFNLYVEDVILFMRPEGNFDKDFLVKQEILTKHIKPYYNVKMAFDDNEENIKMFQENDILGFQVFLPKEKKNVHYTQD